MLPGWEKDNGKVSGRTDFPLHRHHAMHARPGSGKPHLFQLPGSVDCMGGEASHGALAEGVDGRLNSHAQWREEHLMFCLGADVLVGQNGAM